MNDASVGGTSTQRVRKRDGRRGGWSARLLSILIRLLIWFCIITILFRCPSNPDDVLDSSPRICAPYLDLKTRIKPYTAPYYTAYAAPYVEKVEPYAAALNANLYTPAITFARSKYDTYGAARVIRGQAFAQQEWELRLKPWLQESRQKSQEVYEQLLARHVNQASNTVSPYVERVKAAGVDQYQAVIIPTYHKARPYLHQSYTRVYRFASEVGFPYILWLADTTTRIVRRRIWPPVRILYGENVLPQLMKIKERLASYRDGKRLENFMQAADPSLSESHQVPLMSDDSNSHTESAIPRAGVEISDAETIYKSNTASPTAETTTVHNARQVSEDLKIWQAKFAKAADKGAEGLQDRVAAIATDQIENQARGTGEALLTSLEEGIEAALKNLKLSITGIVATILQDDNGPPDEAVQIAKDQAQDAVRSAGRDIKVAAENLRAWRQTYDVNTENLINAASESVLEVVDNIRDLGLQEIGMRWASMDDGVSYKDWSEFHTMRKTFAEWRGTVQSVVVDHRGAKDARQAGEDIESRGMAVAEDAARELARLKEVSFWKIDALDATDDFRTRYAPPKAAHLAEKLMENAGMASESVASSNPGVMDSIASYAQSVVESVTATIDDENSVATPELSELLNTIASPSSSVSSVMSSDALSKSKSIAAQSSSVVSQEEASTTLGPNGENELQLTLATAAVQSASNNLESQSDVPASSAARKLKDDAQLPTTLPEHDPSGEEL